MSYAEAKVGLKKDEGSRVTSDGRQWTQILEALERAL